MVSCSSPFSVNLKFPDVVHPSSLQSSFKVQILVDVILQFSQQNIIKVRILSHLFSLNFNIFITWFACKENAPILIPNLIIINQNFLAFIEYLVTHYHDVQRFLTSKYE